MEKTEKQRVLEFFKTHYESTGCPPSVNTTLQKLDLYRNRFYELFPKGKNEVCIRLGIPTDKATSGMMAKVRAAKTSKKQRLIKVDDGELAELKKEVTDRSAALSQAMAKAELRAKKQATRIRPK